MKASYTDNITVMAFMFDKCTVITVLVGDCVTRKEPEASRAEVQDDWNTMNSDTKKDCMWEQIQMHEKGGWIHSYYYRVYDALNEEEQKVKWVADESWIWVLFA